MCGFEHGCEASGTGPHLRPVVAGLGNWVGLAQGLRPRLFPQRLATWLPSSQPHDYCSDGRCLAKIWWSASESTTG